MVVDTAMDCGYRFEQDSGGDVSVYGPSGYLLDTFHTPPSCKNLRDFQGCFWSVSFDLGKYKVS